MSQTAPIKVGLITDQTGPLSFLGIAEVGQGLRMLGLACQLCFELAARFGMSLLFPVEVTQAEVGFGRYGGRFHRGFELSGGFLGPV